VDTVTVVVPVSVLELSVIAAAPPEQVGKSVAPVGEVVNAQVTVTAPAYPVVEATVTVELALPPGTIAAGEVAATV
jgi:hypothetical protein